MATHAETQQVVNHAGGTTTTFANFTAAAGSLIIVSVCLEELGAGNPTCSNVAFGATNNTTPDITRQLSSTDSRAYIFSFANVGAGTVNVVSTHTLNAKVTMYVTEVTGAATASHTDGAGASATATSASAASGTFTTTNADDFWFALFQSELGSVGATPTIGGAWTIPANGIMLAGDSDVYSAVAYINNGGGTSGSATFTITSSNWACLAFAYKNAGGAIVSGTASAEGTSVASGVGASTWAAIAAAGGIGTAAGIAPEQVGASENLFYRRRRRG